MRQALSAAGRNDNDIRVEIVTTYEQLLHAYSIRAICFMEEHGVSAGQTFDGNDYQATHVIVYAGNEPVGTARIRWFKDFAKMERTSFREKWRDVRTIKRCADFIFEHIARKGYDRVITHAKPKYARLWRTMLGFQPAPGKVPLHFEGHDEPYHELVKVLTPPADAISSETDTAVLFRIEGHWDARSEFEAEVL
ncbi:hypothetical protein [Microvirga antarctica]|uniref:hypothetical protein n=1 Tax=Microvirga antarctica TaxID=2819233 RepID=UPI001FE6240A|nr:hypothetical protein [Microvirga antarctica]